MTKRFTLKVSNPAGGVRYELRDGDRPICALGSEEAIDLGCELLSLAGWTLGTDVGLRVGDRDPMPVAVGSLEDAKRKLRASGIAVRVEETRRVVMAAPWKGQTLDPSSVPSNPQARQRRFVKEPAAPPAKAVVRPADERKLRAAARDAEGALAEKAAITQQLFTDPVEQLRYEVTHFYLHSVPPTQREEYPLGSWDVLPMFMADLEAQSNFVSRQQMLSAIVDIVCNRVWEVNSRQARAKREGGGEEARPPVIRSFDNALAWRANVSSSTPAARRIMWWQTPLKHIELARLTTHDDYELPER